MSTLVRKRFMGHGCVELRCTLPRCDDFYFVTLYKHQTSTAYEIVVSRVPHIAPTGKLMVISIGVLDRKTAVDFANSWERTQGKHANAMETNGRELARTKNLAVFECSKYRPTTV
jgi:hypothetical protein